jgi:hypothetical protein
MNKPAAETGQPSKTTLYIGGFVYENDVVQFVGHEEGRIRYENSIWNYDYFLKDHLGNIRTVLTQQQKTDAYPAASLETAVLNTEKIYYNIPDAATVRVNKSTVPGYPADTYTTPNDFIHKLSGSDTITGSSIVLKVMSGDKYNIRASSWWKSTATPGLPVSPLAVSHRPSTSFVLRFAGVVLQKTRDGFTI